jgi:hypothetical protein
MCIENMSFSEYFINKVLECAKKKKPGVNDLSIPDHEMESVYKLNDVHTSDKPLIEAVKDLSMDDLLSVYETVLTHGKSMDGLDLRSCLCKKGGEFI